MFIFIMSIILFIISIILFNKTRVHIEEDKKTKELNEFLKKEKENLISEIENKKEEFNNVKASIIDLQEISKKSFEEYNDILDAQYKQTEEEYDALVLKLEQHYDENQDLLKEKIEILKNELQKIKSTLVATKEAQTREKQIKEDLDFYSIRLTENELDDVRLLEKVKPKLHQPRILCMLIWSTYYQKPMTALCNNILGPLEISGIYKITNQETNQCYIGQAVDVAKR